MRAFYLYFNAILYLLFAIWCTLLPTRTATSIGFLSLSPGGRSEYLVIYGGLQLGLAAAFACFAREPAAWRMGIVFSALLYGAIVVYRVVTVARFWPVGPLTVATGCLELVLFACAAALLASR